MVKSSFPQVLRVYDTRRFSQVALEYENKEVVRHSNLPIFVLSAVSSMCLLTPHGVSHFLPCPDATEEFLEPAFWLRLDHVFIIIHFLDQTVQSQVCLAKTCVFCLFDEFPYHGRNGKDRQQRVVQEEPLDGEGADDVEPEQEHHHHGRRGADARAVRLESCLVRERVARDPLPLHTVVEVDICHTDAHVVELTTNGAEVDEVVEDFIRSAVRTHHGQEGDEETRNHRVDWHASFRRLREEFGCPASLSHDEKCSRSSEEDSVAATQYGSQEDGVDQMRKTLDAHPAHRDGVRHGGTRATASHFATEVRREGRVVVGDDDTDAKG